MQKKRRRAKTQEDYLYALIASGLISLKQAGVQVKIAVRASLIANCCLAVLQIYAAASSLSLSFFGESSAIVLLATLTFWRSYCERQRLRSFRQYCPVSLLHSGPPIIPLIRQRQISATRQVAESRPSQVSWRRSETRDYRQHSVFLPNGVGVVDPYCRVNPCTGVSRSKRCRYFPHVRMSSGTFDRRLILHAVPQR